MTDNKQGLIELVQGALEGPFDAEAFYSRLAEVQPQDDLANNLVEVFWALWLKYETTAAKKMALVEAMKYCLADNKVDQKYAMETLDHDCLQAVGLIPQVEMWKKKEIRHNTKVCYTQHKFNLLREDSEGYAKLITLLNHFGDGALSDDSAEALFAEVQALIGCFELDPNRVLDLVLEGMEQQPQNKSYLKVIRHFKASAVVHILGFKFQHYQYHEEVPGAPPKPAQPAIPATPAPTALFMVAAELIQAGFIKLEELLGHLRPEDDEIKKSQAAATQKLQSVTSDITSNRLGAVTEQAGGGKSLQGLQRGMTAAMFELDADAKFGHMLLEENADCNQKLRLLEALLKVGDWDNSKKLMDRLFSLGINPPAYRPVSTALCALLGKELDPIYSVIYPRTNWRVPSKCILDVDQNVVKGLKPGPPLSVRAVDFMLHLGCFLARDIKVFFKVARVLRHQLVIYAAPGNSEAAKVKAEVLDLVSNVLLPALALIPSMPAAVDLVWALIKDFPSTERFRVYEDFKEVCQSSHLLTAAADMALVEAKRIGKRVAVTDTSNDTSEQAKSRKDQSKLLARMINKIWMPNPWKVMEYILQQVEVYENMIRPYSDVFKYAQPMTFDVLTHAILSHLADERRERIKPDGLNVSDWVQFLAKFTGTMCRKYAEMDVHAILQFIVTKLRDGDCYDLLVLEQIMENMANMKVYGTMSAEQVDRACAGEALQARYSRAPTDEDAAEKERCQKRGMRRLLEVLQKEPSKEQSQDVDTASMEQMLVPLLYMISQLRTILHGNSFVVRHIKFLAELLDRSHITGQMYIEMLQKAMGFEEYCKMLPDLATMRKDFGVEPDLLFQCFRPLLNKLYKVAKPVQMELEDGEHMDTDPSAAEEANPEIAGLTWETAVARVRASAEDSKVWESISPEVYTLFWSLDVQDIYVPEKLYAEELESAKHDYQVAEKRATILRHQPYPRQDEVEANRAERASLKELLEKLPQELEAMQERVKQVHARLNADKAVYFSQLVAKRGIPVSLVQECIVPRMLYSPQDALFCAKFPVVLYKLDVTNFSVPWFYNQLFSVMVPALRFMTDREAANTAIVMGETWVLLSHWRSSPEVYDTDCKPHVGFYNSLDGKVDEKTVPVDYDMWRRLVNKWGNNCLTAFQGMLQQKEYTSKRNALTVLSRIVQVWPTVKEHGEKLMEELQRIRTEEDREDLKTMAMTYGAQLKQQLDSGRLVPQATYCPADSKPTGKGPKGKTKQGSAPKAATTVTNQRPDTKPATAVKPAADPAPPQPAVADGPASARAGRADEQENGDHATPATKPERDDKDKADRRSAVDERASKKARHDKEPAEAEGNGMQSSRPSKRHEPEAGADAEQAGSAPSGKKPRTTPENPRPESAKSDRDRDAEKGREPEGDKAREREGERSRDLDKGRPRENDKGREADKGRDRIDRVDKDNRGDRDNRERDRAEAIPEQRRDHSRERSERREPSKEPRLADADNTAERERRKERDRTDKDDKKAARKERDRDREHDKRDGKQDAPPAREPDRQEELTSRASRKRSLDDPSGAQSPVVAQAGNSRAPLMHHDLRETLKSKRRQADEGRDEMSTRPAEDPAGGVPTGRSARTTGRTSEPHKSSRR